jgi:hypothetical protein
MFVDLSDAHECTLMLRDASISDSYGYSLCGHCRVVLKCVFLRGAAFVLLFIALFPFVWIRLVIQIFIVRIDMELEIVVRVVTIAIRLVFIGIPSSSDNQVR